MDGYLGRGVWTSEKMVEFLADKGEGWLCLLSPLKAQFVKWPDESLKKRLDAYIAGCMEGRYFDSQLQLRWHKDENGSFNVVFLSERREFVPADLDIWGPFPVKEPGDLKIYLWGSKVDGGYFEPRLGAIHAYPSQSSCPAVLWRAFDCGRFGRLVRFWEVV